MGRRGSAWRLAAFPAAHTHTHDLLSLTIYTRFRLPHLVYRLTSCRYIVLTTSLGIMDHEEMRRKSTGGKILGFFY